MKLDNQYNYAKRQLPDGRWVYVNPLTYGRACINISSFYSPLLFDTGYEYETPKAAVAAMEQWIREGGEEPTGWFRNPQTGRRRPGGNPDEEYIAF